jgi:hypothetical protein
MRCEKAVNRLCGASATTCGPCWLVNIRKEKKKSNVGRDGSPNASASQFREHISPALCFAALLLAPHPMNFSPQALRLRALLRRLECRYGVGATRWCELSVEPDPSHSLVAASARAYARAKQKATSSSAPPSLRRPPSVPSGIRHPWRALHMVILWLSLSSQGSVTRGERSIGGSYG